MRQLNVKPARAFQQRMPARLAMAALAGALCAPTLLHASHGAQPLPLAGAAYRVAQQAYDACKRRAYSSCVALAREAIRQRPDVMSLHLLLADALAAQRQYAEAGRVLNGAVGRFGPDPQLVEQRKRVAALRAPANAAGQALAKDEEGGALLTGTALEAAKNAYQAYNAKDFAGAARYANEVIALRPDLKRFRLLLIDASSAAGDDAAAWDADMAAVRQFGDSEPLRIRREFIGVGLGMKVAEAALNARQAGDTTRAIELARQAVVYAPARFDYRLQLIDGLLATNDLAGMERAMDDAIAYDDTEIMAWTLRGYARAAQGKSAAANADLAQAAKQTDATAAVRRSMQTIAADIWLAQGEPQRVIDMLGDLKPIDDDTDSLITMRVHSARLQQKTALAAASAATATPAPSAETVTQRVAVAARPVIDCASSEFGSDCDLYPADPGFAPAQAAARAAEAKDTKAALEYARQAVQAAPQDAQHRVDLVNALIDAKQERAATSESKAIVDNGLLDALPPLSAAYIAQRAGDDQTASDLFERADKITPLSIDERTDAAYSAMAARRNQLAIAHLERAIDAGLAPPEGDDPPPTPQAMLDMREAHADATRNWGFDATLSYRGGGMPSGPLLANTPGDANAWQLGVEGYWRPFGPLGDRMFEVYARAFESFGVKGGEASGAQTLQAAVGARVKPFADVNAIFAIERVIPIGSAANGDWLARAAYSDGFGTERRIDVPSWWTGRFYAEAGRYLQAGTNYATTNAEFGRTYRIDRVSSRWTVFPYVVIGADYDSSVNGSVPIGAGVGVSTRYVFRESKYDAPRSYVDVSLQYRFKLAGDDRARGVFFNAIYSY
ncbi:NfrA family protein [Ralstonia sp. 24A2]|uniref:NfrA family protein n=1 Tax=Ralstonia sp. 24A2 TaxID=3447364 RepID=UPI003F6A45BC